MSTKPQSDASMRLHIGGMSCAACVRRVERILLRVEGVTTASVNLATEEALVEGEQLRGHAASMLTALEKGGYDGRIIEPENQKTQNSSNDTIEAQAESRAELVAMRSRIFWALLFSVPLFLLSMAPMLWSPLMDAMMTWKSMQFWNIIAFALCVPVQFWIGFPFYRSGIKSLLAGSPDMNTLVLLGTNSAFAYSLVATFAPHWLPADSQHVYYESSAVVITLILIGKYWELRARGEATRAMQSLLELQPYVAMVQRNNTWVEVDVSTIRIGELVEIKPGSSVPLDAVVESGGSYVDESMLTGEPIPVAKHVGDTVIGGTLNGNGVLYCRVTHRAANSTLARIMEMVRAAQGTRPKIQSLADTVVAYFVPIVMLIAVVTFLAWWLLSSDGFELGLIHAAAVLIVACPCAMGLAVPISIMVASGTAAKHGVLFRNGQAIQSLSTIDLVALDKTGTVTEGKPKLHEIELFETSHQDKLQAERDLLGELSELQAGSEHPLANAVLEAAKVLGIENQRRVSDVHVYPGLGISGKLRNDHVLLAGSERFLNEFKVDVSATSQRQPNWETIGASWFYVAEDQKLIALVSVMDTVKQSAASSIRFFKKRRIAPLLVSGDHEAACRFVGEQLGIDREDIHAGCTPESKATILRDKISLGRTVAFVGDGINDSLALSCADVGVAIGTGTDLAIESADVVLMGGDLKGLCDAIEIASATMRNIKQNLVWAFGYNILLIPLATGLFQPYFGLSFSPMLGALAMSLSSVFVVSNALRLRRIRFTQSN
ncbi:MAG: heavy metal translocating P-type ATPase [Pirellula sp.]|nr:heavy metal translocating P-type ATPase [Pirellula sp.]